MIFKVYYKPLFDRDGMMEGKKILQIDFLVQVYFLSVKLESKLDIDLEIEDGILFLGRLLWWWDRW
jgi:hypothetical protein